MLELPEALSLAKQLNATVAGKTVERVLPPSKPHKFCWFNGDPADYDAMLGGKEVCSAEGFGIFAELAFSSGLYLCFNDGVNLRYVDAAKAPKNYQLTLVFTDHTALVFTVAMYGGIYLHQGDYDNVYYLSSRHALSPFSANYAKYYEDRFNAEKQNLSVKAFLATEQRFPGIGNGVLQDILFTAHMNPKRKIGTLSAAEKDELLSAVVSTLNDMTEHGGRDTEKDLFGNPGGYGTQMSQNTVESGCPRCGDAITKETYLGGSVYYCPNCQPIKS